MDQEKQKLSLLEDQEQSLRRFESVKRSRRWIFLIIICLIEFGRYYCVDTISSMEREIKESYDVGEVGYNSLYSSYSFPNAIIPFLMGYLADKFGKPLGLILFVLAVVVGQSLVCISAQTAVNVFALAVAGRFIFGCFGKSVSATQYAFISDWFKSEYLACALALTVTISRFGTVLNYVISPLSYRISRSLAFTFWIGAALCVVSLICAAVTALIDQSAQKESGYKPKTEASKKISLRSVTRLGLPFWVLTFCIIFFYNGFLCFVNISTEYARSKYEFDHEMAGLLASVLHFMSAATAPAIGFLTDKFGRRTIVTLIACILLFSSHTLLCFLPEGEGSQGWAVFGYFGIGTGYAMFTATSWPMIPFVVDEELVGTAFGIGFSGENLGNVFGPLIIGGIAEANKVNGKINYFWVSIFLTLGSLFAIITNIWLIYRTTSLNIRYIDSKRGGVLMAPNAAERQKEMKLQREGN